MIQTILILLAFSFLAEAVDAHEMTPAYPELRPSHIEGVSVTDMEMFNKRADVKYYEIGVFDAEWNAIPFVSSWRIMKVEYLGHVKFSIYIRDIDSRKAEYICSRSKLRADNEQGTLVSSRICSRIRKGGT